MQAKRRLEDWLMRYQFHTCGAVTKIANIEVMREKERVEKIISPFSNGIMEGTNN